MYNLEAEMIKVEGRRINLVSVLAALAAISLSACDPPRSTPTATGSNEALAGVADTADVANAKIAIPKSGDVVLFGGWGAGGKSTASAEFYDPNTGKFTLTSSMAASAGALSAELLDSGKILVAGGFGGKSKFIRKTVSTTVTGSATNNLQTYDPTTGIFTATTNPLLTKRFGATATTLPSGKVLIAGGVDTTGTPLNTAEVFDPVAGATATTAHNMSSARAFHTATLVSGKVLLIGGAIDTTGDLTATADLYDPTTDKFTATGSIASARGGHATVVLTSGPDSGKILVVGGITGSSGGLSASADAELYDPGSGTFSAVVVYERCACLSDGNSAGQL
jgi:hypothetical protein